MPISFPCPHCQAMIDAPEERAGRIGRCPLCGNSLVVPEPIMEAVIVGEEPNPPTLEPAASRSPMPPAEGPVQSETRKPCPVCGEMIVATAAKCRFCGAIFDPGLRAAASGIDPDVDKDLDLAEWLAALFLCGGGCLFGIAWMLEGKPKGKKMFAVSLFSPLLGIALFVLGGFIAFLVSEAAR